MPVNYSPRIYIVEERCPNCCITLQMKHKLQKLGKGCLIWTLTEDQLTYITHHYPHYLIEPHIYKITASRAFCSENTANQPEIIKKLIGTARRGKEFLYSPLKKKDIDTLEARNIDYEATKFIITSGQFSFKK